MVAMCGAWGVHLTGSHPTLPFCRLCRPGCCAAASDGGSAGHARAHAGRQSNTHRGSCGWTSARVVQAVVGCDSNPHSSLFLSLFNPDFCVHRAIRCSARARAPSTPSRSIRSFRCICAAYLHRTCSSTLMPFNYRHKQQSTTAHAHSWRSGRCGRPLVPSAPAQRSVSSLFPLLSRLLYAAMEAERESNWSLPVINVVMRQLRMCAYGADALLESSGEKARHMIEVQDVLKRFLQKMVIDRAPLAQSKKQGCLFIIVHLFKLYFRLNNLKLCTFLIKMVSQLPPLKDFPKAQVMTRT